MALSQQLFSTPLFKASLAKVRTASWRRVEAQQGHDLRVKLPTGHWQALRRHCQQSGETQSAVVRKALADYLDHHTLWQLSTSTAVVEGFFSMGSVGRRGLMAV